MVVASIQRWLQTTLSLPVHMCHFSTQEVEFMSPFLSLSWVQICFDCGGNYVLGPPSSGIKKAWQLLPPPFWNPAAVVWGSPVSHVERPLEEN